MVIDKSRMSEQLTARQKQIIDLLVQFKSSKEIALEIGISSHTVDNHIDLIKRKFGFSNRRDIARGFNREFSPGHSLTYENLPIGEQSNWFDNPPRSSPEDLLIEANPSQCIKSKSDLLGSNVLGPKWSGTSTLSRLVFGIVLIVALLIAGAMPLLLHM